MSGWRLWLLLSFGAALLFVGAACATPVIVPPQSATTPVITPTPTATPIPTATPLPSPTPVPVELGEATVVAPAPTPTPTPIPVPGLTETTMRIGVIADLNTSATADNLGLGAYEGATAWVDKINRDGGLAGRAVELVLADSRLLFHDEAVRWVCDNDIFALVGSKALLDGDGVEVLTGDACGIPDFPAEAEMPVRRASAVTFLSSPFPSPFYQAGPLRYLANAFPESIDRVASPILPLLPTRVGTARMQEAGEALGFVFEYDPLINMQDDYSLHVEQMIEADINGVVWTGDADRLIELMAASADADFSYDFVLCDSDCYSNGFLDDAGELAEGISAWIPHLPFNEPAEAPEVVNYMFAISSSIDEFRPSSQGVSAWAAGLLFEEAVERAVGAGTPAYDADALTRESLIAAARTIDSWDANGMYGPSDPARGIPSSCFVLMRVVDGTWTRQHPLEAGTMDCANANRIQLIATAALGLDDVAGSATPLVTAEETEESGVPAGTDPLEADEDPLE